VTDRDVGEKDRNPLAHASGSVLMCGQETERAGKPRGNFSSSSRGAAGTAKKGRPDDWVNRTSLRDGQRRLASAGLSGLMDVSVNSKRVRVAVLASVFLVERLIHSATLAWAVGG